MMLYKLCRRCKKTIPHPAIYCGNCFSIIEDKRQQLLRERENRYNKNRDQNINPIQTDKGGV